MKGSMIARGMAAVLAVSLLLPPPAAAQDQFRGFQDFVDRGSLKPFTRDLGSILGAASFHRARPIGIGAIDLGAKAGFQFRPSPGNEPLRRAGVRAFGLPWVQAEVGLPFNIDGFIRGISVQGVTIAGGGLRWFPFKFADQPDKPQALFAAVGHSVAHKDFSASHVGVNFVVAMGVRRVTPYVGAGIDRTRVVVRSLPKLDASLQGEVATTNEARFTAGISVKPNAYTYLYAAGTYAAKRPGIDLGLGIRY